MKNEQCCQIFLGTTYKKWKKYMYLLAKQFTKWPHNLPSDHTIYQMTTQFTKWPHNLPNDHTIYQMTTQYTKWFYKCFKGPQSIPTFSIPRPPKITKYRILVLEYTIWQPFSTTRRRPCSRRRWSSFPKWTTTGRPWGHNVKNATACTYVCNATYHLKNCKKVCTLGLVYLNSSTADLT
jgi:hypothetical protein